MSIPTGRPVRTVMAMTSMVSSRACFSPPRASAIIDRVTPHDLLSFNDPLDLFVNPNAGPPDALIERGLIPPVPVVVEPNPALVWGWPIVRRAAELGVAELETRTLHIDSVGALLLAVQMESRTGRYSWAEQEAIVSYLETAPQCGGAGAAVGTEAGDVDWPAVSRLVRGDGALVELVGRYRKLGPGLRGLVNDEFTSLKTAERIVRVPGEFLISHHPSLDSLSFSARRQFLELLAELIVAPPPTPEGTEACAEACAWAAAALDERDPVAALRRRRYPALTHLEDQFRDIRRASLHGTGVGLEAPPYFEGDSFAVSFRFRNCAELVERTRALERLRGSCDQLFGIL